MNKLRYLLILTLVFNSFVLEAEDWDWWNGTHDEIPNHTATVNVSNFSELQAALNNATAGNVIYLAPGVYAGLPKLDGKSGTVENPIIITADPTKEFPIIRDGFKIEDSDYWELSNIQFEQRTWDANALFIGIYEGSTANSVTPKPCHHWKVDNCNITNGKAGGIHIYNTSSYGLIKNTRLWNLGKTSKWNEYIYMGSGTSIGAAVNNITVEGCEFWGFPASNFEAIEAKPATYNITIQNNFIHDMHIVGGTTAIALGTGGHASGQTYPADANYICKNNRFLNINQGDGGDMQGCIGVGIGSAIITNNIIVNCDSYGIRVAKGINSSLAGDTKHVTIENNIIWNSSYASIDLNTWASYSNQIVNFTYDISGNILDRAMNISLGDNVIANTEDFESALVEPYDKGNGPLSGFFSKSSAIHIVDSYTITPNVTTDIIGVSRPTETKMSDYGAFEFNLEPPYTLNIITENGSVSKSPDKIEYDKGDTVILIATADSGYMFDKWSGDTMGTSDSIKITMNRHKNIYAVFKLEPPYSIEIEAENGSVLIVPDKVEYQEGDTVTLTAIPDLTYQFVKWSGDISGTDSSVTIIMDNNKSIVASFSKIPIPTYRLTVNAINGIVTKSPYKAKYDEGETVTLMAKPNSGYQFDNWSGDFADTSAIVGIIMNSNKTITANFSEESLSILEVKPPVDNIFIYPNPGTGLFDFNFTSVYIGEITVSILTIDGREIKSLTFHKQDYEFTHQIDLTDQDIGTYFIKLQANEYHVEQLFILNN